MTPTREPKKRGPKPRPPEELLVWRSVRLRPETLAAIERVAQARGVTTTDIIREAVAAWLKCEETATDGR